MKEPITVTVVVPNYDSCQILTHGCFYTCPTKCVDGESYFRFKNQWYKVSDYTDEHTRFNTIGGSYEGRCTK